MDVTYMKVGTEIKRYILSTFVINSIYIIIKCTPNTSNLPLFCELFVFNPVFQQESLSILNYSHYRNYLSSHYLTEIKIYYLITNTGILNNLNLNSHRESLTVLFFNTYVIYTIYIILFFFSSQAAVLFKSLSLHQFLLTVWFSFIHSRSFDDFYVPSNYF